MMKGMIACCGWALMMAAVITPSLGLNVWQNLVGGAAGSMILMALLDFK